MSEIGKTKTGEKNNFYGRKHTEEYKRRMSEMKRERYKQDAALREKVIDGTKAWAKKNREKYTDEEWRDRYAKIGEKNRIRNKGQIPWNKGKTLTEEHKRKISESEKRTKSNGRLERKASSFT